MKLYYVKATCSLASHIVLEELGVPYEAVRIDFQKEESVALLKRVNPLTVVPVLELDDGQVLTEGAAILQYLADLKPEKKLAPPAGSMERYRLEEWLNFISTEIHKGFSPLFGVEDMSKNDEARHEIRAYAVHQLGLRFAIIEEKLGDRDYLMPGGFTVADAYLFTVLNWASMVRLELARWPRLEAYVARVRAREASVRAMKAERMI